MRTRNLGILIPLLLVAAAPIGPVSAGESRAGQAAATPAIAIVPRPVTVKEGRGIFTLTPRTTIWTDRDSEAIGRRLSQWLEPATGLAIPVRVGASSNARRIVIARDRTLTRLGPEGYRLTVTPTRVNVSAPAPAGLFYGIQTLRQLLPPDVFREAKVEGVTWQLPSVTIEDQPRFAWRGGHLDSGRHFMPKEFVKKFIDLLALHKMNTFHWHLTEDQGWRIEIKKYPRLTEVGAWRSETLVGRSSKDPAQDRYDGVRHGGFYTQDDVREIVAYARDRFVTVVPEIEMPGHAIAAIAAYPDLGVDAAGTTVATRWGVFDNILNPTDASVTFMQDVLTEVLALFPSQFIHIGGDEAAKGRWKASAQVQARIKELGLKDEHEMQSWFIRQMDTFLASKGRRLIGWDEILEGGLAPGATVMSWRGVKGGIEAAKAGHDVVMTPTTHTYFDYYQSKDRDSEPLAIGGFLPLETVYSYEPVAPELGPEEAKRVLGTQGQLWTEYLPTPKHVEYMAFPRLCALAEVAWTPAAAKDYADFTARLLPHVKRLAALDVRVRQVP